MTFFTRREIGRVYVIKIVLPDDTVVHKIGMTKSNRATDRMMEILRSWFVKYRFMPYAELRLDMECSYPAELESHIHKVLAFNRFEPDQKVDGGTEMFTDINEVRVIHYLRNFNENLLPSFPDLSEMDYRNINRLVTA